MSGQLFIEKMATQLMLNNNAFALIIRSDVGTVQQLYPITKIRLVEQLIDKDGSIYLRFTCANSKVFTFAYEDILHLRRDYYSEEILGDAPGKALTQLLDTVGTVDQGIVNAVKNSGVIRWLLKFNQSLRPEDLKKNTQEFVSNYLSLESDTFGAAATDSKMDAKQIEPKDYVPNAAVTDRITNRLYAFFNTNQAIVTSSYTENQWTSYYESVIEPIVIQISEAVTDCLFSVREQEAGNKIIYEASNLMYASLSTKLSFVQFVDRGIMCPNEVRKILNLAPIPGGDEYIRRLDTAPIETKQDKKYVKIVEEE